MLPLDTEADSRTELIGLVKIDYETTRGLVDGLVRTSLALRGAGLALTLALVTFAVQASSFPVALCGIAAVCLFLYLDAYHGWLYAEGVRRARELERLLALRYKELERGEVDQDIRLDLDVALAMHRFGQYSNIKRFRLGLLKRARPAAVYAGIYGGLGALTIAASVYSALT